MTQPLPSATHVSNAKLGMEQDKRADNNADLSQTASSEQPAIVHPNFDPKQTPLDPARSLRDIPEPARRHNGQLRQLYGHAARFSQPSNQTLSKWQLIASKPFAEHLALLSAARLIELPESFYRRHPKPQQKPHNQDAILAQSLLSSLESMTLLDLADIQNVLKQCPKLNRYGVTPVSESAITRHNPDELLNSLYADDWQVILQPQDFETGAGSLATDILACSTAVHILKQCPTRKSINQSYSAEQICHYARSYLLSQLYHSPTSRYHYRQIRLFTGHIIVAAYHLGWKVHLSADGQAYFNLSSRCGLFNRYANINDYMINGWSSLPSGC